MATDALSQYVALVYRLDQVGPKPRELDQYLDRAGQLNAEDAWMCLRQLQPWLASFAAQDSATFITKIVEMASQYRVPNPPTLQDIYKALPAGMPERGRGMTTAARPMGGNLDEDDDDLDGGDRFDAAGWLDKAGDDLARDDAIDTMELFLFKTAALILDNMRRIGGLRLVPLAAVTFFFASIEYGSTLHVQRCAAYCSGVLSTDHLRQTLEQFDERQKALPEKKFRWLLYQQATQMFAFGVATQEQAEATVAFLQAAAKKITKIDRGKLRGSVCTSLYRIFGSIMGKDDEQMQRMWGEFTARFQMLARSYSEAYYSIYQTVSKWAKKAKHALPCWRLMVRMTCVGSQTFYLDRKRDAILPILLNAAKKLRHECLGYIVEYLEALPIELARTDMEGFVPDAKKLLALCFPKKKDPEAGEEAYLIAIVNSIGRLNAHFAFTELTTMIPAKESTVTQKALLCHALGSLAKVHQREVVSYNNTLGPLMLSYMEAPELNHLAVNAIRSFPYVTVPDPVREKVIVEKVVQVAVIREGEPAETAFASIVAYLMQAPDMMLVPLVSIFLTTLSSRSFSRGHAHDYAPVLSGFSFLQRLLLLYLGGLEKSGKPCAVNASEFIRVREHCEGVTIMWLAHCDAAVRALVLEVLRTFSHPTFIALEDGRSREPLVRLASMLPPAEDGEGEDWSCHLDRILSLTPTEMPPPTKVMAGETPPVKRGLLSERLRGQLEYAWVRLVQRFHGATDQLDNLNAEKLGLWKNYTRFLCVAVAFPNDLNPAQMQAYGESANERVWPQNLEQFWATLLRIAWTPGMPDDVCPKLLDYFEQIHPTCIEHAVRVIKELRDAPPQEVVERRRLWGKKKVAKVDENDELQAQGWIFHEEVLQIISRFVARLTKTAPDAAPAGAPAAAEAEVPGPAAAGGRALPRSLAQTLAYCVDAWVADFERLGPESCRKLSLGTRNAGMRMVRVYLTRSAGVMDGAANVPPAMKLVQWLLAWTPPPRRRYLEVAYRQYSEFVAGMLLSPEEDDYWERKRDRDHRMELQEQALEVAVVDALEALLKLAPLKAGGGEPCERLTIHFLQMMALRGPQLRKPVERAFAAFLRFQPGYVGLFFKNSIVEFCGDQNALTIDGAELLASMHLASMVACWSTELTTWLDRYNVPLVRMLLVCLLHQCSPDASSRQTALELASALARNPNQPLDAGAALLTNEFVTLSSCVAATYKYSQVLAVQCSAFLGEPLLRELVSTAKMLPDVQNESMLHMIMPWISHFGKDFSDETVDEWRDIWTSFLGHLMSLSFQCHSRANSSFLFFTLEACWTAVLASKQSEKLTELTVQYLVTTHAHASKAYKAALAAEATAAANSAEQPPSGEEDGGEGEEAETAAAAAAKAKESASLMKHLCNRVVVFIGASGRSQPMLTQLLTELPTHGTDELPPSADAQPMIEALAERATRAVAVERQGLGGEAEKEVAQCEESAFLLTTELLMANIELLKEQMPVLLHLGLVHFGPSSENPRIGQELVSKLLAKLTALPKAERAGLERPPDDVAGREALMAALCVRQSAEAKEKEAAASLREAWAAVTLAWAMSCPRQASVQQALSWYEVLTRHRQLTYVETHKLTAFLAASLHSGRNDATMAVLGCLNEHAKKQESIGYLSGVLLCVSAILCLNCANIITFASALSLLRSTLDRLPAGGTAELSTMQLLKRKKPPPLAAPTNIYERVSLEHKAQAYDFDPEPSWKSRMLQEALDAQLGIWQRRAAGLDPPKPPPSADELLRMLLLRGGSLSICREDTIWLISELRAIYQPHLPPCDEMGVSYLWLSLLQACAFPLKPKADTACERAWAWLLARGGEFGHLGETFQQLHSSAQRAGQAYAWAATGKRDAKEDSESWRGPLVGFLHNLKQLFTEPEQQQRAFGVMVEACCVWLILLEVDEPPSPAARTPPPTSTGLSDLALAGYDEEEEEEEEGPASEASSTRWAALSMLGILLSEFPGFWEPEQHSATAELLSSYVFLLRDRKHAAKLREDMQFLVRDPRPGDLADLFFVHQQLVLDRGPERAVGVAAELASTFAKGAFPDFRGHLQVLPEDSWVEILTALVLKLGPTGGDVASKTLAQRLGEVTIAAPSLPPLPSPRLHQATMNNPAAMRAMMAAGQGDALEVAPAGSREDGVRGLSVVMAPPAIPGVRTRLTRGESISALLPPPPPLPSMPGAGAGMMPNEVPPPLLAGGSSGIIAPPVLSGLGPAPPIGSPNAGPPPLPPMPGGTGNFSAPPPPVLGAPSSMVGAPPPPVLGAPSSVVLPPAPVLGTRGGAGGLSIPPPPQLAAAAGSGRAPPPPMLASARRATGGPPPATPSSAPPGPGSPGAGALSGPPPLQQTASDLGWSEDEAGPEAAEKERSSFSQHYAATREFI